MKVIYETYKNALDLGDMRMVKCIYPVLKNVLEPNGLCK